MNFIGLRNFKHEGSFKTGVLLVNLGTPDAPTAPALRRYLKEFLWDHRVIEKSRILWWFILNGLVLPTRPKNSAKLYSQIWTDQGSPLLIMCRKQTEDFKKALASHGVTNVEVALGMRYGNPSIRSALRELFEKRINKLFILPLYPQYSATSTGSSFDAVVDELKNWRWVPDFKMIMSYHDHPAYIRALAQSINEDWAKVGKPQKLVISFHGIPLSYFEAGDPYYCFCQKTGRLLAESLGLSKDEYTVTFQSQFGKEEWLKPATIDYFAQLGKSGIHTAHAICPGFTADCLETIEEINVLNREAFLANGGKNFHYINALNDRPAFIQALFDITKEEIGNWFVSHELSKVVGVPS